jgi:DNA-binding SARP family transcriptional activator
MIPLRLLSLGRLRLESDALGAAPNVHRKELVLLAYLARRAPRAVSRGELAALLWGERDEARARHSLRQSLHNLRQAIGEGLEIGTAEVRLREGAVVLDAAGFEQDVAAGRLKEAAARWAGDFLREAEEAGGEAYRSWLEAEREGLRRRLGWTLERLAEQAERQGAWAEAVQWTQRWAAQLGEEPPSPGGEVEGI